VADPQDQPPAHWASTSPQRILAPDGTAVGDPSVGLDPEQLRGLLRWMLLARRLDAECIALQRQGQLTVYPGFEGQEAAQVGSATALGDADFAWPTFRELAVALVRGVDPVQYLQYHRGTWHGGPYDPRATRFGPICIPIATQIAHAAGYEALLVTVDLAVAGKRERDLRNDFAAPFRPSWRNSRDVLLKPAWLADMARHGIPEMKNLEGLVRASTRMRWAASSTPPSTGISSRRCATPGRASSS